MNPIFVSSLAALLLLPATVAVSHPHTPEAEKKEEKSWPYFGEDEEVEVEIDEEKKVEKKGVIRLKTDGEEREFRWNGEELPEAMKELELALKDGGSEAFESLSGTLAELSAKFEMRDDEDGAKAFVFDGEEMMRFHFEREEEIDNRLTISGLGRNLTVERETTIEDGKSRTRIVIEMDGGDDVEIDLPDAPEPPEAPDAP